MPKLPLTTLKNLMPETNSAINQVREAALKEGNVDEKTFELMILCYAIANKCDACINDHIKILIDLGATEEDIATVAAAGAIMGGGPGRQFGNKAIAAFYRFKDEE